MINNIDPEINSPRRRPDQSRSRDGGSRGASRRKAGTWTCLKRAFAEINWSCYIDNIDRSRFSTSAGVELRFPEPDLPEPPPPETGGMSDTSDDTGTRVTAKNVGTFIKSVNGTISAPFGDKCGHKGLDIAARTGTPIVASRAGTAPFAGSQSGYGNVVCLTHEKGVETRYADMSRVTCRRGLPINHGDKIGEVG